MSAKKEVYRLSESERVVETTTLAGKTGYKRERYGQYGGPAPGSPKWHACHGPVYPDLESAIAAKEPVPPDETFIHQKAPDPT